MEPAFVGQGESYNRRFLVDVYRGDSVESRHTVHAVVCGAEAGERRTGFQLVVPFARSAIKPLQALVLVESGAADRFGLNDDELAVAAGSHAGDRRHADVVTSMLAKGGFTPADLDCGVQRPLSNQACDDLARRGVVAGPLHNNCSGKHAGLLLSARHLGLGHARYRHAAHPLQKRVAATVADVCGVMLEGRQAVDGCGVPTYAIPLDRLAYGFARFATGTGLMAVRAAAAARLRAAIAACPTSYSGIGRLDTRIAEACGGTVLLKSGAEGVMCAAVPATGLGVAVKAIDGASRAAEAVLARLLLQLLPEVSFAAATLLVDRATQRCRNCHGEIVGRGSVKELT